MSEQIFYQVSEVSDLIGCSKSKAYELVASGIIPSTHIGSLLRVPCSGLEAFIKRATEQLGFECARDETRRPALAAAPRAAIRIGMVGRLSGA